MSAVTVAYLVGFSAVYLVAVVVIMSFAGKWRRKAEEAQNKERTTSVRRLVRLNSAAADVHDAMSYQKRTNEASKARIRRAEEQARANAQAAEANSELLEESREAGARIAAKYAAGTDLLGQHAQNMHQAAEAARRHSFSRAAENARLLRELERDIEALYKGAVTPQEVEEEVAKLEAELAEIQRASRAASDGFYSKVSDLLSASDAAQRETGEEIATMYATKAEAESQASELLADVGSAKAELESQYDGVKARADEVEAACGLRNSREMDPAALDAIQTSYDTILSNLSDYASIVDENDAKWRGFDARLTEAETSVSEALESASTLNAEVGDALSDLDDYIKANCTPRESVAELEADIETANARADRLGDDVEAARVSCEGAKKTCGDAEAACTAAQGQAAMNLAEGGVVNVEDAGTLSLSSGTLSFCTLEGVCTDLN